MQQRNVFNKGIIQNGYYVYEFWKSKTYDYHILLLNLSDAKNLKRRDKYVALSNLSLY